MTQEKSPMESRNLCGKNVAKFRNLLAGSPSQEKLAAKMQLEGLNIPIIQRSDQVAQQ